MLVLAAGVLALSAAHAARLDQSYSDPAGDSATAPDITTIDVSNNAAGTITMAIAVANQPTLAADAIVFVRIDADANPGTGNVGAEYVFQFTGATRQGFLFRWDGTSFPVAQAPTLSAAYAAGVLRWSVSKSDLGGTGRFAFLVVSAQLGPGGQAVANDFAPSPGAVYEYTLTAPPPLGLTAGKAFTIPARPAAGKALQW